MRTARGNSRPRGGVVSASVHAGKHPPGVGLETPGWGPGDPSPCEQSSWHTLLKIFWKYYLAGGENDKNANIANDLDSLLKSGMSLSHRVNTENHETILHNHSFCRTVWTTL